MTVLRRIESIPQNGRAYIYGAGVVGKELYAALKNQRKDITVAGFITTNSDGVCCGEKISTLESFIDDVRDDQYDYILIASSYFKDIISLLEERAITKYFVAPQQLPKAFIAEFEAFERLENETEKRFPLLWEDRFPVLHEKTASIGFERHYTFHPAWAARILSVQKPAEHIDISSMLHFATLVSAFIPVKYYEFRPPSLSLPHFSTHAVDLFNLPFADNSIPSISCMHVVEHVGLGRYGDPLDYDGDLKAIAELQRVLAPEGDLLFVVPIGRPRIMFNGHRIYSYDQIVNYFGDLSLVEFSLIPDSAEDGDLVKNATKELVDNQTNGCGCFWYRK